MCEAVSSFLICPRQALSAGNGRQLKAGWNPSIETVKPQYAARDEASLAATLD